jgi:two-component system chemotaxis response regulator CheB
MSAPRPDLVVVGGSAGGVEALKQLVSALPADLPATVLVGLHLAPTAHSMLTEILGRQTALEVVTADHGVRLTPGRVVVARADRHLLVDKRVVVLGSGPPVHGSRPSHDAMMRSVALARGPRAVGVVLTGLLQDGAAGLACLARYGAACLVQAPEEAEFPSMPEHALAAVPSALSLPLLALAAELDRLVRSPAPEALAVPTARRAADRAEVLASLGPGHRDCGDHEEHGP